MKIFNTILLNLLVSSKILFSMQAPNEETTFKDIPPELYGTIAKQAIVSIIHESSDIFIAVDEMMKFLKNTRLINKAFNTELTQNHILNELIKTFKETMKSKFASNLLNFSCEQLNEKLQELTVNNVLHVANTLKQAEKLLNKFAKLIIAGANPNLVTSLTYYITNYETISLLSDIIINPEFHKLIPLLLIYGADVSGEKIEYGKYTERQLKYLANNPDAKAIIKKPIFEAINLPKEKAIKVLNHLNDYKVNLYARDSYGYTPLEKVNEKVNSISNNGDDELHRFFQTKLT